MTAIPPGARHEEASQALYLHIRESRAEALNDAVKTLEGPTAGFPYLACERQAHGSGRNAPHLDPHAALLENVVGFTVSGKRPGDITLLLRRMGAGDEAAREALFTLIYTELHEQAAYLMRGQRRDHTLQATALVNEAYLKLVNLKDAGWEDRLHFFGVAGKAMRSVLADHARAKRAAKRGGGAEATALDTLVVRFEDRAGDLVDLDDALRELEAFDARAAAVVELRFFAGLTCREVAQILGVSVATIERDWEVARAWLYCRLG